MSYIVYAIYNLSNDKIYIGQTMNLAERLRQHNDPSFPKFTSRYSGSWELIHQELFISRKEALVREKQLKSYQGRMFVR